MQKVLLGETICMRPELTHLHKKSKMEHFATIYFVLLISTRKNSIFVLFFIFHATGQAERVTVLSGDPKGAHARLIRDIMDGYEPLAIPRPAKNVPVNVSIDFTLLNIDSLSEKEQVLVCQTAINFFWFDPNLAWNTSNYDYIEHTEWNPAEIWKPSVFVKNSVEEMDYITKRESARALSTSDGRVHLTVFAKLITSCSFTLRNFPFDSQSCSLIFTDLFTYDTYQSEKLIFAAAFRFLHSHETKSGNKERFIIENSEWELLRTTFESYPFEFRIPAAPDTVMKFQQFVVTIHLKRRPKFYLITLVLPLLSIAYIPTIGFLLPIESGEKVSLQVTAFLSYMVLLLVVVELIPAAADQFPILGEFIVAGQVSTAVNLFLTIITIGIFYKEPSTPPPKWLKYFYSNAPKPINKTDVNEDAENLCNNQEQWQLVAKTLNKFCFWVNVLSTTFSVIYLFVVLGV